MLETIRSKATGWIAYFILGLVIIPFVLWGVGNYSGFTKEPAAASVNGEDISKAVFNLRFERLKSQPEFQQIDLKEEKILKRKFLEDLIHQTLLNQSAKDLGLRVSEEKIRTIVLSLPVFQENGKFSRARFERVLQNNSFTAASFLDDFKKEAIRNQLEKTYRETDFATEPEAERLFLLLNEKRDLDYLLISPSKFVDDIEVSEEALSDFYQKNKAAFKSVEEASFLYVEIAPSDLKKNISISDEEIKTYFEQNIAQFELPERRAIAHILISGAGEKDKIPPKIDEILSRLNQGEEFASLAKKYSDDAATSEKGGALGLLTHVELPAVFNDAAFALRLGETSKPIKTEFGWHLIRVTQIVPSKTPEWESVKEEAKKAVLSQKTEVLFAEKEEELARLTFEHPESLAPAAKTLGLTVKTSPFLKRTAGGDDLFSNPKVLETAFSEEVLQQDQNSATIEVSPQHLIVLRKGEYRPAHLLSYEEIKDEIREELVYQQARTKTKQLANDLIKKLNEGQGVNVLSQEYKLEQKSLQEILRSDEKIPLAIRDAAFKVGPHKLNQYQTVYLPAGDAVIFVVKKVRSPSISDLNTEKRKGYADIMRGYAGQVLYSTYLFQLKRDAEIRVHNE